MKSSALAHLETLLHARKLGATLTAATPPVPVETMTTGIEALDVRLAGGWPRGALSEVIGPRSSGRTGVLVSTLAAATREGHVVALVDGFDRFDPRSAAEAGVDLDRLLWVRGAALTVEMARGPMLDRAVQHAVRAFDLILRAGGFAIVVLDLADAPHAAMRRLPSATWLRLAHVIEGQTTVALVACASPAGRSARGVSVHLDAQPVWSGDSPQSRRLDGLRIDYRLRAANAPPIGAVSSPLRAAGAASAAHLESCG